MNITLGNELTVNRLGFGAMRITGEGIWGEPEDRTRRSPCCGEPSSSASNLIDTADSYGPNVSEELIAEALHPYPDGARDRHQGRPHARRARAEWEPDGRPEYLRAGLRGQPAAAEGGADRPLPAARPDPKVPYAESVGALKELQDEGKIRHDRRLQRRSRPARHGPLDRRRGLGAEPLQPRPTAIRGRARRLRGRRASAFIPWFPLAVGELAKPGGALDEIAAAHDATPGQIALAWLLGRSPVMLPIPGTSSVAHLEENVAAAAIELSEDELATLSRISA